MRRAAMVLLLAGVLMLAGCSAGGGGGNGTDPAGGTETAATERTMDATAVATDTTATAPDRSTTTVRTTTAPPSGDAGLPREDLRWVNESGIRAAELLRSHAFTVNNASGYALRTEWTTAEAEGPNESVRTREFRASADQRRAILTETQQSTVGDRERVARSSRYREVVDGEGTEYTRYEADEEVSYRSRTDLSRSFQGLYDSGTLGSGRVVAGVSLDYEFDRTVERDGTTLYRFTADSIGDRTGALPDNVTDLSATMLVDERGVVRSLEYTFDSESAGTPVTYTVAFELIDLGGTTVDRPDWFDEARDAGLQPIAIPGFHDGAGAVGSVDDPSPRP